MAEILERRGIKLGLVLVVLSVWGYNMLKIIRISSADETAGLENNMPVDSLRLILPDKNRYEYHDDFPDPFGPELTRPRPKRTRKSVVKPKAKPKPVKLPQFRLTGVIDGTALLQSSNSKIIYFAVMGDTLEGARLTAVTTDSVVMNYKSKTFTVKF